MCELIYIGASMDFKMLKGHTVCFEEALILKKIKWLLPVRQNKYTAIELLL